MSACGAKQQLLKGRSPLQQQRIVTQCFSTNTSSRAKRYKAVKEEKDEEEVQKVEQPNRPKRPDHESRMANPWTYNRLRHCAMQQVFNNNFETPMNRLNRTFRNSANIQQKQNVRFHEGKAAIRYRKRNESIYHRKKRFLRSMLRDIDAMRELGM